VIGLAKAGEADEARSSRDKLPPDNAGDKVVSIDAFRKK
jgi:hypothetical protein